MTPSEQIPVVVLDRDGTILEDRHYIRQPEDVVFYPGAVQAIRTMREKGYPIFVASNQSGVARGVISEEQLRAVDRQFRKGLEAEGIVLDHIAYCCHGPDTGCGCRKPRAGLVPQVFKGRGIHWASSFVVGDQAADLGLGAALGAASCLVLTGKGEKTGKMDLGFRFKVFENLADFAASLHSLRSSP